MRSTRPRFCEKTWIALGLETGHTPAQPSNQKERKASSRELFIPLHEPNGDQLREIASLIDLALYAQWGDRVFPFESTMEALAYVEQGRAKGKVVVKVR